MGETSLEKHMEVGKPGAHSPDLDATALIQTETSEGVIKYLNGMMAGT